ncbi:trypsin-like serine protease [Actinomadura xylanilytica]|uniref:trypsin-like serine protease n=1 Tax=Actinomadura xylanilytica TaxID=887459 RepID=UPI00255AC8B2|nr:trypsin-like serine protease [Actinomadura xylanilytica]MDL4771435.1 trypsin-like serine protease [Actinomadura xylanilytica]
MRKFRMWGTAAAVTSAAVVTAGTTLVLAGGQARGRTVVDTSVSTRISAADAGAVQRYWTRERMAAATPLTGAEPGPDAPGSRAGGPSGRAPGAVRAQAVPTATAFAGIPTLGALFFNNGTGDHYCTASVVNSFSKKLLITAAHCIHGGKGGAYSTKVAFVPRYDQGKRPYGTWAAGMMLVDQRWQATGDADLDFGYIALNPLNGKLVQDVVGYNKLAANQGVGKWVNVTGYPRITYDKRDRPIYCRVQTARQSAYQIRMDCGGFYGGTSGSPWLLNYSTTTHTGVINGVIGGYQGGGTTHSRSYSPYFDDDAYNLRTAADKRA